MAARRPPSRARANTQASQPLTRPNSVLAKNSDTQAECNIQVVIRTRRRSEREKDENSPNIVSSDGPKSKEISIETSSPVSNLGVVSLPPVRTYPFDLVFGPEADQSMIYHDVVSPMLEQVLGGYNCTLFAYGQTGTGKTYTMQGDMNPTPMGNPSAQAGMIPRVLFRLFHNLETSGADFSVKISYIELYNEELRDLLSSELAVPSGQTQPMGHAVKDNSSKTSNNSNHQADGALKMFDDSKKGGVMIQGLEEVAVKDCKDALALLQKGSHRRQIAATKFNDHSSRSHSVFTITVHTKESAVAGEDMLKIGKMNLVDLAGSENIGRSGAENKRAREAGMINQSLLTLGRVINALVDKAPHVPYRESKLTRLLQDSLGGRTKTCIIATISPARSNREETLSTLDYALHAKSILNKPELNARMTRNSLLKEYIGEIDRLKADLLAAREKSGIFISEERWEEMNNEQELRQTELDEAKRQTTIVESQLRSLRDDYDQSIAVLKQRESELQQAKLNLSTLQSKCDHQEREIVQVKRMLEEEIVVRRAHQSTEADVNEVALGLKRVATQSLQDMANLFDVIERKAAAMNHQTKAIKTHSKSASTSVSQMSQSLDAFVKSSGDGTSKLSLKMQQFQTEEVAFLQSKSDALATNVESIHALLHNIHGNDQVESSAIEQVRSILHEVQVTLQSEFSEWASTFSAKCDQLTSSARQSGLSGLSAAQDTVNSFAAIVDAVGKDARTILDEVGASVAESVEISVKETTHELARLRNQNNCLQRLLAEEKLRGEKAKDDVLQRVSGLLGDYMKDRDLNLRNTVESFHRENEDALRTADATLERYSTFRKDNEKRLHTFSEKNTRRTGEGKRLRDGALKTMKASQSSFSSELDNLKENVADSVKTWASGVQERLTASHELSHEAFATHSRAKRVRLEATESMSQRVTAVNDEIGNGFSSASEHIQNATSFVTSELSKVDKASKQYQLETTKRFTSIRGQLNTMVSDVTKESRDSSNVPPRRDWTYRDDWELTKSRPDLLKAWRKQGQSAIGSETFVAESCPLPEDMDEDQPPPEPPIPAAIARSHIRSQTESSSESGIVSEPSQLESLERPPLASKNDKISYRPNGLSKDPKLSLVTLTRGSRRAR